MHVTIRAITSAGLWGFTVLWLSACEGHALTASLGKSASLGPAGAAVARPGEPGPVHEGDLAHPGCTEQNARDNCHDRVPLVGYPVEQAVQRARAAGFTGKIEVLTSSDYDASCKDGTVCAVRPDLWEINFDDELTLLVNRKVAISAPE